MRNVAVNVTAGLLTVLLFVAGFGALSSCGKREYAPVLPPQHSSPTYVPRPYLTPDPAETAEPSTVDEPDDVDVRVDHDGDDHKSRFCRRHWYC